MADLNVYVDGDILPSGEATVSVFDHSFLYGDGVFEGIRIYDDRVFKLDAHLDRLYRSAKMLDIEIPLTHREFKDAIAETLRANPETVTYIRPVVSRGSGPLGIAHTPEITDPTIVIIPQERPPKYDDGDADAGLELKILSTRRTPFEHLESRIKANNYINNILGKLEVIRTGVDDGIMLDSDGYIAEACAGNVFCVHDEALHTPPAVNILNGITRQTVLELAEETGYDCVVEPLTPYDLITADEAFITSTMTEIKHIAQVDGRTIGDGTLGTVTRDLTDTYRDRARTTGYRWK